MLMHLFYSPKMPPPSYLYKPVLFAEIFRAMRTETTRTTKKFSVRKEKMPTAR